MSHPTDGDRFSTQQPEEGAWNEQPHSQPEASQHQRSPHEAPQASGPGQQDSSSIPGQSFPAGPAAQKSDEANFFKAMVDFKFDHFITVKFSTFLYIVAFVVALLLWLGEILVAILFGVMLGSAAEGFYGEPSFNPVLLVLAILFGWIPSVISLIAMRLGLEFSVATVRTAQNTKRIAEVAEHGR